MAYMLHVRLVHNPTGSPPDRRTVLAQYTNPADSALLLRHAAMYPAGTVHPTVLCTLYILGRGRRHSNGAARIAPTRKNQLLAEEFM